MLVFICSVQKLHVLHVQSSSVLLSFCSGEIVSEQLVSVLVCGQRERMSAHSSVR